MSNQQPPTKKIKIFSSESLVNAIPVEIWRDVIGTKLGYFDRSHVNATCKEFNDTFENYNQQFLKKHAIHIPQDAPTIEMAMALVRKLQLIPTEKEPLRIVLDKGVHEIDDWEYVDDEGVDIYRQWLYVHHNHIAFVGKGKDQTTILGGFFVGDLYGSKRNVTFEDLAITNPVGEGLHLERSETTVDVLKCVVTGMTVRDGATVTATQCEFMKNANGVYCAGANTKARLNDCTIHHNYEGAGLNAFNRAVVDLHGTKTDIHSNWNCGILANWRGKVNIHLPSQHNTTHDNGKQDRNQAYHGSIANINADGTFTHVWHEDDDHEDDDY
jgi:hypothetical protein